MSEDPIKKGVEGLFVDCRPVPESDPKVIERRHRSSCLMQVTPRCSTCKNGKFTLFFETSEKRLECVKCPRWADNGARMRGERPVSYVTTEVATCKEKPFEFCPSCPSKESLGELDIDKDEEGWYNVWSRAQELLKEDDDG